MTVRGRRPTLGLVHALLGPSFIAISFEMTLERLRLRLLHAAGGLNVLQLSGRLVCLLIRVVVGSAHRLRSAVDLHLSRS